MSWKYINPGDRRLLHNWSTSYYSNYVGKAGAPRTGRAFYVSDSSSTPKYPITVPDGIKEMWMRYSEFVAWCSSTSYYTLITLCTPTYSQNKSVSVYMYSASVRTEYYPNSSSYKYVSYALGKSWPYFADIWLHVKSGITDGVLEVYVDRVRAAYFSNVNILNGEDIKFYRFYEYTANSAAYSDIIMSDEPIDMNEHCAILPIKATTAEGWTYDETSGVYTTDAADKTLWRVPDVDQFKKEIGYSKPKITSISTPAFGASTTDDETVDTIKQQVRQNQQTADGASASISSTATNILSAPLTVNPVTNTSWTLSDLSNAEFGLTTAKSVSEG